MKWILFFSFLICSAGSVKAQLKFIIEDFEGCADGTHDVRTNGIFGYGNIKASIEPTASQAAYSGGKFIKLSEEGKLKYGGWGKGININVMLDPFTDYLNFYVYQPADNDTNTIKIELQEDDDGNNIYDKNKDDSWAYLQKLTVKNTWQLISIPLNKFTDSNKGGDAIFNINYREGKLLTFIISFIDSPNSISVGQNWSFDFICFSKGELPTGVGLFDAPLASPDDFCNLGAWSQESNPGNFTDIAVTFEGYFNAGKHKDSSEKKLGVIHFFQPFSFDGGTTQNSTPSVERINKVIQQGYIPMITLEDHYANLPAGKLPSDPAIKQPNLYSIVEGYFDSFFITWAKQIKQVNGTVLLRILHEFNGDWYPWCIVNSGKDPLVFIRAYRHIHDIFNAQYVTNVKFIWCPNSLSYPQENWNFIMNAYPGSEYVDFVGLDAYNGAGQAVIWRSFRKEAIEDYFILTQQLPDKPLFICEVSSRERKSSEPPSGQNKAEWIKDMSKALSSDMSKIKLLTWFNQKNTFKINTSPEAENAYDVFIWRNDYFKSGTKFIYPMLQR